MRGDFHVRCSDAFTMLFNTSEGIILALGQEVWHQCFHLSCRHGTEAAKQILSQKKYGITST